MSFPSPVMIESLPEPVRTVKSSMPSELTMVCPPGAIIYTLSDNGSWKEANFDTGHYGLTNMERRCRKNGFGFTLSKQADGTHIEITVPVNELIEL